MPALIDLTPLVLLFLALALALIVTQLTKAVVAVVAAVVGKIPLLGSALEGAVHSIGQAVIHALGVVVGGIDSAIGWTWHESARLTEWLAHEIWSHASLISSVISPIEQLAALYHTVKSLVHSLEKRWHGIEAGVKQLTREWHGIERRVRAIEHALARGIGNDVRITVKALEKEVATIEHKVIPGIEAGIATAEGEVTALEKWVKSNALLAGTTALTGAVAWALSNLGMGWLRCSSNPFSNNKNACGLWSQLARLLPLGVLLTIAFDFQEFVTAAEDVAQAIGGAVAGIEGTFATSLPPLPPPT